MSPRFSNIGSVTDRGQVSTQIARLFKDDPDLRSDFHIFMPESVLMDEGKRKVDSGHLLPQKRKRRLVEKEPKPSSSSPHKVCPLRLSVVVSDLL